MANLNAVIDDKANEDFEIAVIRRKVKTKQVAVQMAVEFWTKYGDTPVGIGQPVPVEQDPAFKGLNPAIASWVNILARILGSDRNVLENREAAEAVCQNLRVLYRHIGGDPDALLAEAAGEAGGNPGTAGAKKPHRQPDANLPAKKRKTEHEAVRGTNDG